ncbi:RsfA family transcriptional regulator [Gracilibacillus sp. YIM 98692]|uniref:RsfA family transcriptional regulator n=1 Tax=Gracilibacillus sp. YIM 98692 TaxID=2663532 RepID=UPI0013D36EE5|nr:RsfA family transcriptional regulator [Gracilibacillus sp. YIM 98692]
MQGNRQDAWTKDEDILLAETVLRFIREGRTQLEAFKEVGEQLSRTSAACGFRWNATLRKQYEQAIQLAKSNRKKIHSEMTESSYQAENETPNIHQVIQTLENLQNYYHSVNDQNKLSLENEQLKKKVHSYRLLFQEIETVMEKYKEIKG